MGRSLVSKEGASMWAEYCEAVGGLLPEIVLGALLISGMLLVLSLVALTVSFLTRACS